MLIYKDNSLNSEFPYDLNEYSNLRYFWFKIYFIQIF